MKRTIIFFLFALLGTAHAWGLFIAPPDASMGEVYRILYVHVPAAWNGLLVLTCSFLTSLLFLLTKRRTFDDVAASTTEVGVVLAGLTLILGSLWGRPTWGVWWTWDPRLTTTLMLFLLYAGLLILRRAIDDPERRALVTNGLGLLVFLNVPIVYFSVRWWRGLHQIQSSPDTMAPEMVAPLRFSALILLGISIFFVVTRSSIAKKEREKGECA